VFTFRLDLLDDGLGVAFTDRLDGASAGAFQSLNLSDGGVDPHERANAETIRRALDVTRLIAMRQVHGTDVLRVPADAPAEWDLTTARPELACADAAVTTARQIALCVRVADCVPVLLADARAGVIGAAHAGRKGLLAGVLETTVAAMRDEGAQEIDAWIGPHICGSCYEVPSEMAADAWRAIPATQAVTSLGTPAIDLGRGAAAELERLGCRVSVETMCTLEDPTLFSYRGDGVPTGRQAGIVWLR